MKKSLRLKEQRGNVKRMLGIPVCPKCNQEIHELREEEKVWASYKITLTDIDEIDIGSEGKIVNIADPDGDDIYYYCPNSKCNHEITDSYIDAVAFLKGEAVADG